MGGATLPLKIFVPCMVLICFPAFVARFALADEDKKTIIRPRYTYIYAFCLHWCVSVSLCALSCIMYARMYVLG